MPAGERAMNFRAWHPGTRAAGSVRHTPVAATVPTRGIRPPVIEPGATEYTWYRAPNTQMVATVAESAGCRVDRGRPTRKHTVATHRARVSAETRPEFCRSSEGPHGPPPRVRDMAADTAAAKARVGLRAGGASSPRATEGPAEASGASSLNVGPRRAG